MQSIILLFQNSMLLKQALMIRIIEPFIREYSHVGEPSVKFMLEFRCDL
jgi:hypothetical protein